MSDPARYRAAPFHALRGRQGNKLVSSPLTGERRVMPDGVFTLLDHLRAFRTLSEHAENAARRKGTASESAGDIRRTLDDLRRQGMLISEEEFFRAALPKAAGGSAPIPAKPISTIAIPASSQSKLLPRCIGSYAACAAEYGHTVRFVIAGASADSVAALQSRFAIMHLDRGRLEELARAMGQEGVDPAIARFALFGEADGLPPGVARNTGANRNALLLECAEEAFLSVDDDTHCSFARSPSWRDGLAIHSSGNPLDMWFGPELPDIKEPARVDILTELGRALGPAIRSSMPLSSAEFDHSTLGSLCRGDAMARVVQVGLRGDAATDSPTAWLMSIGATRERLVGTEAGYRAAMSSRSLFAASSCETVSASRQMMAYCVALDHREMLPPFPPLGRDQDGVFGSWERIVEPDSFTVHVPFAISHEPAEARSFPQGELWPPRGMSLNDALHLLYEDHESGPGNRTPAERLQSLGSRLERIADSPPAEFAAFLIELRLKSMSRRVGYLEAALKLFGSRPAWWVKDIQRFARCWEEEMAGPDILQFVEPGASVPENPLAVYQTYVRWCGRLLREWPAMREIAIRLRRSRPYLAS